MNGNLIFHSQSFTWEDLTIDRSDQVEKFISLTEFIRNKDDKIKNNDEIWNLKLSWGYFTDLIFGDLITCPWLSQTQKHDLVNILSFQPVEESYQKLKIIKPNQNNGEFGIEYPNIPSEVVIKEEDWYRFHFNYLSANPQKWEWNHEYFPNLGYWKMQANDPSYSDLLIIEFMDKHYKGRFKTNQEKLIGFEKSALGNGGEYRKLSSNEKVEFCRNVVERNFYTFEQELSSKEKQLRNSQREIYSVDKNSKKLYLSMDHENGAIEVCHENGVHQGVINLLGKKIQEADGSGKHDIWALK